jgi:hypothetical protein
MRSAITPRPLRVAAPKRTLARGPARRAPVRAGSGDLDRVAAIEDEITRQVRVYLRGLCSRRKLQRSVAARAAL